MFPRSCDLEGSRDPKIDIFKSYNFVGSKSTGFENLLHFALSLTVSEVMANLLSWGHVTLRGHVTLKVNISKSCNFVGCKHNGFENLFCFALSLTVSEKTAILTFFKNWPKIGRQMAVLNLRMSIFDWPHFCMMPVKCKIYCKEYGLYWGYKNLLTAWTVYLYTHWLTDWLAIFIMTINLV